MRASLLGVTLSGAGVTLSIEFYLSCLFAFLRLEVLHILLVFISIYLPEPEIQRFSSVNKDGGKVGRRYLKCSCVLYYTV